MSAVLARQRCVLLKQFSRQLFIGKHNLGQRWSHSDIKVSSGDAFDTVIGHPDWTSSRHYRQHSETHHHHIILHQVQRGQLTQRTTMCQTLTRPFPHKDVLSC